MSVISDEVVIQEIKEHAMMLRDLLSYPDYDDEAVRGIAEGLCDMIDLAQAREII